MHADISQDHFHNLIHNINTETVKHNNAFIAETSFYKTILQGTLEGSRRRDKQRKNWSENVKEWTKLATPDLLRQAQDRPRWSALSALFK
jgi:hypothetical protein